VGTDNIGVCHVYVHSPFGCAVSSVKSTSCPVEQCLSFSGLMTVRGEALLGRSCRRPPEKTRRLEVGDAFVRCDDDVVDGDDSDSVQLRLDSVWTSHVAFCFHL